MSSEDTDVAELRGIFDCKEAYKTPTHSDHKLLFSSGTIIVDTNVLINLYRSNDRTRKDTFAVLGQLKSQLWIPHQVLIEFWRNRDLPSVRGHHKAKARTACSALDKALRSMRDAADRWLKDVHLDADTKALQQMNSYRVRIQRSLDEMKKFIETQAESDALDGTESTHTDPILLQLEPLLLGRVGPALSQDEYDEAVKEAKRRADQEVPPGYADYDAKPDEQAAGDYIIWKQIMTEAARNKRDVLLITGDLKEDWWTLRTGSNLARPRSELKNEIRDVAGVQLFMMTPSQLLSEASDAFELKVDERSVSDLARREGGVDWLPRVLRNVIVDSLEAAHARALSVHKASGLTTRSPYGLAFNEAVMYELNTRVASLGGQTLTLNGIDFPILEGFLLVPQKVTFDKEDPVRVMTSRRMKTVAAYLNPEQERLDFGDSPQIDNPVVVQYSATPEEGLHYIAVMIGAFNEEGVFDILWRSLLT